MDQVPTKPIRMGTRTSSVHRNSENGDSAMSVKRQFPVMGVDAKITKHNKNMLAEVKQWESDMNTTVDNIIRKDLTPFLDSCDFDDLMPVPVVASTFLSNKVFGNLASAEYVRSPVSTKSKAKFATVSPYFKI